MLHTSGCRHVQGILVMTSTHGARWIRWPFDDEGLRGLMTITRGGQSDYFIRVTRAREEQLWGREGGVGNSRGA